MECDMKLMRFDGLELVPTPGGNESVGLATSATGSTEISLVYQRQAPGGFNPNHFHSCEEVMRQLAGQSTVTIADEEVLLMPGDTLIVPANTLHAVRNLGSEASEWLIASRQEVRFFKEDKTEIRPIWAGQSPAA
jgi:mannose-6-phosphate isomerase-like protein (cupin superfamily)